MKLNEGATKKDKRMALALCIALALIAAIVLFVQYNPDARHGTGGLPESPDEERTTSLNESFNITFTDHDLILVNDVDAGDVAPYEPYLILTDYSEVNLTDSNDYPVAQVQNWEFLANMSGTVDLYFYSGEYTDLSDSGTYMYDFWIRVVVEE